MDNLVLAQTGPCMYEECPNPMSIIAVPAIVVERRQAGMSMQTAWPEANSDDRELMGTGTHGACWRKMLGMPARPDDKLGEVPPHMRSYVWIRTWGNILGSYSYYIEQEQDRARADKAPETAIYKSHGSRSDVDPDDKPRWVTLEEVTSESARKSIEAHASYLGLELPQSVRTAWDWDS